MKPVPYNIPELIPQRPPIVMVDHFLGFENNDSHSSLLITEDNIFVENGCFTEPGLIEHVAQSAAARIGYICKENNLPIALGYIGSVDKLTIFDLPKVGEELNTIISIIQEVGNITLIVAIVKAEEKKIMECRLKIFLDDEKTEEK